MNTRGWLSGGFAPSGGFVNIHGGLYQVLSMSPASAAGRASIEILPHLAADVPDGALIEAYKPFGLMAMTDDAIGWTVSPGQRYSISFSCEEAR